MVSNYNAIILLNKPRFKCKHCNISNNTKLSIKLDLMDKISEKILLLVINLSIILKLEFYLLLAFINMHKKGSLSTPSSISFIISFWFHQHYLTKSRYFLKTTSSS